jgi:hypothetical protein
MNKTRNSSRLVREAEKARLARRAERQRGRLLSRTKHLGSRFSPRSWLGSLLSLPASSAGTMKSRSTFHPLLVGAVGLILPRLIRRHPMLRMAALGWSAFQLVKGSRSGESGFPAQTDRSAYRRR